MTAEPILLGDIRIDRHGPQRSITVFVDQSGCASQYSFIATSVSTRRPVLVQADDLRSALRVSKRLDADRTDQQPMPILVVNASSVDRLRGRGVRALPIPSAIASLLFDCALIRLADGAVVVVDPEIVSAPAFLDEVARILRSRGIIVNTEIAGWELRVRTGQGGRLQG